MKGYINSVHNLPENGRLWFPWKGNKRKSADDFRMKLDSNNELQKALYKNSSQEVLDFVSDHLDLSKNFGKVIFTTAEKSYIDNVDFNDLRAIINFKPLNTIKYLNKHFASVNILLPDAGIYIGRVETYWERKINFYKRFGKIMGRMIWLVDFVINRILPKLRPFNKIYRFFSNDLVHPRSKAEILGRLVYNGFDIIEHSVIDNLMYFVVMKTKEPLNDSQPTYHALVKLPRVGKRGKIINVYKFRTMHPYSEYLQKYIINLNGYNEVGKPAYDFRVARWGKFMRKLWIDELPQLINVLKGEMSLVGARPLSLVRYNEFPKDIQQERMKHKPGCLPPYVALNMPGETLNIEAERIYFKEIAIKPYTTYFKYLFKSIYNIVFNKIRGS
jgi:lipopolysaccharide/colanic/teichoic acid biosynthesis glycosyltransferase